MANVIKVISQPINNSMLSLIQVSQLCALKLNITPMILALNYIQMYAMYHYI